MCWKLCLVQSPSRLRLGPCQEAELRWGEREDAEERMDWDADCIGVAVFLQVTRQLWPIIDDIRH